MRRAFTLIELLIVVAIIAILAAIAVPNFLEARTRARVSRTDNDLRTIDLAMESYRIDNNGYGLAYRDSYVKPSATWAATDPRLLSTPIAYVDKMPPDIFRKVAGLADADYRLYGVGDNGSHYGYPLTSWMTWSHGADEVTQTGGYRSLKKVLANEALARPDIGLLTPPEAGGYGTAYNGMRYDPTNGTVSVGDIYRYGGKGRL